MDHAEPPISLFRLDGIAAEIILRVVLLLGALAVFGLAWIGLNQATAVIVGSFLAANAVYLFNLVARDWLVLSDDSNSVELPRGEKAVLRTLKRIDGDSDRLRALMAAAASLVGCTIGLTMIWAQVGGWGCVFCGAGTAFMLTYVGMMVFDVWLSKRYIERAWNALLVDDTTTAISDASESLILSLAHRYEAYLIRGQVWMRVGAHDRAVRDFKLALAERPDSIDAQAAHRAALRLATQTNDQEPGHSAASISR